MTSKHVLIIHTSVFVIFVLASLSSPFFAIYFPKFFSSLYFLLSVIVVFTLTVSSWKKFKGCPFTVWEKDLIRKESGEQYTDSCLRYYSKKWFGLDVPGKIFDILLLILLMLPILVWVITRY